MTRFRVMAVSEEEYAKSDADPRYVPTEYVAGEIVADNEREAERKLARQIKTGHFPRGSELSCITAD